MMDMFTIWYSPRKVQRYLEQSTKRQLWFLASLVFSYFLLCIFILLIEGKTLLPTTSFLVGFYVIIISIFVLSSGSFLAVNSLALALWLGAKSINGKGSFQQTRAAVIWSALWTVPTIFLFFLIYLTFKHPVDWPFLSMVRIGVYIAMLHLIAYSFIVLLLTLSEAHALSLWRAFLVVVMSALSLVYVANSFFKFI